MNPGQIQKPTDLNTASRKRMPYSFSDLDDPLVEAMEIIEVDVLVIVAEIPAVERDIVLCNEAGQKCGHLIDLSRNIQIRVIVGIVFRSAVRDDEVDLEVMLFEIANCLRIFFIRREFARPPGNAFFTVDLVGGLCAAHGKESLSADLIDLPAHQVDNGI